MKNILFLIFFGLSLNSYAQTENNTYRECIKDFYKLLFSKNVSIEKLSKVYTNSDIDKEAQQILADSLKKNFYDYKINKQKMSDLSTQSPSFIIKEFQSYKSDITQGLGLNQIYILIDKAKVYDQGNLMEDYLEIDFPNKKKIFFTLNDDTPTKIIWIWLTNGDLLEGKFYNYNPEKLLLVGAINDPDGFVNIREKPTANSKIVSKLTLKNYFYYTPDSNTDWWLVRLKENEHAIGYIHNSRIKNYVDFPQELKNQVEKDRN